MGMAKPAMSRWSTADAPNFVASFVWNSVAQQARKARSYTKTDATGAIFSSYFSKRHCECTRVLRGVALMSHFLFERSSIRGLCPLCACAIVARIRATARTAHIRPNLSRGCRSAASDLQFQTCTAQLTAPSCGLGGEFFPCLFGDVEPMLRFRAGLPDQLGTFNIGSIAKNGVGGASVRPNPRPARPLQKEIPNDGRSGLRGNPQIELRGPSRDEPPPSAASPPVAATSPLELMSRMVRWSGRDLHVSHQVTCTWAGP